jgi:hypothetical protein
MNSNFDRLKINICIISSQNQQSVVGQNINGENIQQNLLPNDELTDRYKYQYITNTKVNIISINLSL